MVFVSKISPSKPPPEVEDFTLSTLMVAVSTGCVSKSNKPGSLTVS